MDLFFQDMTETFIKQVYDIERASVREAWSLSQLAQLLESDAEFRVGIIDGKAVCYYSYYDICGEANVNNLAVAENYRRKGVGAAMIEDLLHTAKSNNINAVTLEVNENNDAAIALYRKFGFEVEGVRRNFYGKESALIMWKREL